MTFFESGATRVWRGCVAALVAAATMLSGGAAAAQDLSLAREPDLLIGELDGGAAFLFHSIVDAERTPDGRIVVADGGAMVLRVFDAEGRFLSEMGGPGEGPGEFQVLRGIWMAAPDTVGAWDARSRRFTYYTLDGSLAATHPVRPAPGRSSNLDFLAGALADGSVVVGSLALGSLRPDGSRQDRVELLRFAPDGAFVERVGVMGGLVRRRVGRVSGPVAFSPFAWAVAFEDGVAYTDGLEPVVEIRAIGGAVRSLRVPVRAVDTDRAWPMLERRADEIPAVFEPLLEQGPRTDPVPSLAGLLVDDRGRAWTRRFDPATDALWLRSGGMVGGGVWWVVGLDGGEPGRVTLPAAFRPLAVSDGWLLGVVTDEFGVERVAVYRVRSAG